jgi:hypothetical protein
MTKKITKIPGTDRGHFYDVVGCGERGVVGVRDIGGEFRVRIQGWPDDESVPERFTRQSKFHASVVVSEDMLDDTIEEALEYIS